MNQIVKQIFTKFPADFLNSLILKTNRVAMESPLPRHHHQPHLRTVVIVAQAPVTRNSAKVLVYDTARAILPAPVSQVLPGLTVAVLMLLS